MSKRNRKRRPARISLIKINTKFRKKLVVLFIAVMLALVCLTIRITYINATSGEEYRRIVLSNVQQQYQSNVIPYKRGDITDRNGTLLATSERVYNLILDCVVVNYETEDEDGDKIQPYKDATVKTLTEQFGIPKKKITDILEGEVTKNSRYQVLLDDVTMTEKEAFEAYCDTDNETLTKEERQERNRINGIWFEESFRRVYPQNSQACDIIGFTYDQNEASWGIEGYYSDVLNGVSGRKFGYFNSDADVEQTIIEPENGNNVISTIDMNIQEIVRKAIESFQRSIENGPNDTKGAKNTAVIVMDPNSGEILAMDSSGWYDLNNPRDLTGLVSAMELAGMSEEDKVERMNEIWRNYCISDAFEPGSVVKPLTIASAIEVASVTTAEKFTCDGGETISGVDVHCAAFPGNHGKLDVNGAIAYSCNDILMQIVKREGASSFLNYYSYFGFGSRTGIDLPGENAGIMYSLDGMGELELATSSFGQGFTCTMVQEAAAICSVINGGYYYKPHIVSAITDEAGNIVERYDSVIERQPISRSTCEIIKEAMGQAVTEGTAQHLKVEGYSMGAKTGTAEKLPRSALKFLTSVIGFAPLDNPKVLVYVVVDEPNIVQQDSSEFAQVIGNQIFTELLPYLGIYPDEVQPSSENSANPPAAEAAEDAAEGIKDEIPAPLEAETDDEVLYGGNSLYSDGIDNAALGVVSN